MYGTDERAYNMISPLGCMLIEGWGTAILMFVILALTERRAGVLGPHKQVWHSCRGGGLLQAACLHCVVLCYVPPLSWHRSSSASRWLRSFPCTRHSHKLAGTLLVTLGLALWQPWLAGASKCRGV